MKSKPRMSWYLLSSFIELKPWLGWLLLVIIAFVSAEIVSVTDVNGMNISLALGIVLGIVAESKFDLETLYVYGFLALMGISFILMLLLIPLSNAVFKSSFILVSTIILVIIATILIQWLFKNWICRYWGKLWGTILSAIALSIGIIIPSLLS